VDRLPYSDDAFIFAFTKSALYAAVLKFVVYQVKFSYLCMEGELETERVTTMLIHLRGLKPLMIGPFISEFEAVRRLIERGLKAAADASKEPLA
jgi:hypothetical protein